AALVDAFPEPRHVRFARHFPDTTLVDVGNEEARGVGSEVDSSDAGHTADAIRVVVSIRRRVSRAVPPQPPRSGAADRAPHRTRGDLPRPSAPDPDRLAGRDLECPSRAARRAGTPPGLGGRRPTDVP